ncbi:hypothetical protein ACWEO2_33430 [Nocardia sp. NPDC004278]
MLSDSSRGIPLASLLPRCGIGDVVDRTRSAAVGTAHWGNGRTRWCADRLDSLRRRARSCARRNHRLLAATIDPVGARAIAWRFRLALAWIATGIVLGVVLPILGLAVIAAFIPFYWLPISGETARAKRRCARRGQP